MRFLLLAGFSFLFMPVHSQKKLLIIGSSTSTCYFGPSSFDNCYVTRLQKLYADKGQPFLLDNRAVAGDNCYHGMPLDFAPPTGRNAPRPYYNITEGLAANPDVVLVNYPSNGYDTYSVEEVMFCLRTIRKTVNNAGKPCYITTTQPRNYPGEDARRKMAELKERILLEFGTYAIDFWTELANPVNNTILDFYNADGVHLNDNGHAVLFSRVAAKNIMNPVPPVKGGGLQYRYYEGEWDRLPDFNTLTAVKAGSSANVDIGVRDAGVNSNFAFVWEGMINIPVAGNYTFETNSDDGSMLYFNTGYSAHVQPLVNNDGLHASRSATGNVYVDAPGSYPIAITFFEKDGGESMQVFWSGPGIDRQLIPDNAFGTNSSGSGLRYKYYEGDFNTLPDFSSLSPVKSGTTANIEIGARPVGSNDHFAFIWEGYIHIPAPGDYTFETISDDGSKLYFNTNYSLYASAVVNNDGVHASWPVTGTVRVGAAGIYPFAVTYFEKDGGENMQVYWSGPGIARQPIPNAVLSSGNPSFSFDNTTITSKENVNRQGEKLTTPVTGETTIKRVYPSPFNETFNIEFFNMAGNNKIRVDIFDMAGRLYFSYQPGVLATGITTLKVNTTGVRMANGVYMARVSINNKHLKTVKLVKSKRSIQGG